MVLACAHTHIGNAAGLGVPAGQSPVPCPLSTVSDIIVLFRTLSCFTLFTFFFHLPMYVEDRSKDTMSDMDMIQVSACMYAIAGEAGLGGNFRTGSNTSTAQ